MKWPNIKNIFSEGLLPAFERARHGKIKSEIDQKLDQFFAKIDFKTEAQSLIPENIEIAKNAFRTLCDDMGWIAVDQSFEELLSEKSGAFATRSKDKSVPNWYHEFRQILPTLSMLRSGLYTQDSLAKHGGIEAFLIAKLRHDSYEDFGKTKTALYGNLEARYHEQHNLGLMDDTQLLRARHQATIATDVVEMVSRKTDFLYLDADGSVQRHKKDFHNGDLNAFYKGLLRHYFAYELKIQDGIEGLSTRIVPAAFSDEKSDLSIDNNMKYAREKRSLHGRAALDEMAIEKWPKFTSAIRSLDSMLRINLVVLEVVNDHYAAGSKRNPKEAFPIRVNRHMNDAMHAYEHVPKGFNPILIQIERLERVARDEMAQGKYKMAEILENAVYPSLAPLIGSKSGSLLQTTPWGEDYLRDNQSLIQ